MLPLEYPKIFSDKSSGSIALTFLHPRAPRRYRNDITTILHVKRILRYMSTKTKELHAALLIRIPRSLKLKLTEMAAHEHRSLNGQLVFLLSKAVVGETQADAEAEVLKRRSRQDVQLK